MIRGYRNIPIAVATRTRYHLLDNSDWYLKNLPFSIAKVSLEFSLANKSTLREVFLSYYDYLYPVTSFLFIQVPDSSSITMVKTLLFLYVDDSEINQYPVTWAEVCLAAKLDFKRTDLPVYLIKNSEILPVLSLSLKENKLILYSCVERGGV